MGDLCGSRCGAGEEFIIMHACVFVFTVCVCVRALNGHE